MRPSERIKKLIRNRDNEVINGIRYGRSRRLLMINSALSTSIGNLVSGAFIADLVSYLGGTSAVTGIINAIPSLATPVQLFSAFIFARIRKRKKIIVAVSALIRLLYVAMFLLPLMFLGSKAAIPLLLAAVAAYNVFSNITSPAGTNWVVDLVPENIRSRYFANREGVSLVVLSVFMLAAGNTVDYLHAAYGKTYGFLFVACAILVLSILDVLTLSGVDEPETKQVIAQKEKDTARHQRASLKERMAFLSEPFKHRSVRNVMVLSILWSVSAMFGGPFSGAYQVVNLSLDFTYIIALSVMSILIRVVLTPLSGRLAAKIGDYPVMIYSIALIAIHYILWAFTVKENMHFMLPLLFAESAVGFAGINFSMFNVQIRSLPETIRTTALSVTSAVTGVLGFLSTLISSLIVTAMSHTSVTVLGFTFCDLQIAFFITGVIMLGCSGYGLFLALSPAERREAQAP